MLENIGDLAINRTEKKQVKPETMLQVGNRKLWSIPLDTVLLPYFKATNATQRTAIAHDAIGAPLRVATAEDGSVKFNKAGLPIVKISKDITNAVKAIRDNLIAGMAEFAHETASAPETKDAYIAESTACAKIGAPITNAEIHKIEIAIAKREDALQAAIVAGIEHAESETAPETVSNAVTQAETIVANSEPETVLAGKHSKKAK